MTQFADLFCGVIFSVLHFTSVRACSLKTNLKEFVSKFEKASWGCAAPSLAQLMLGTSITELATSQGC